MTGGFASKIAHELGKGIFLVLGKHRDEPLWHYVKVPKERVTAFKSAIRGGSLDVAQFGEILFSGWGKEPPRNIQQKVLMLKQTASEE